MNQLVHSDLAPGENASSGKEGRVNDPARTMAEILEVATHEFADKGLAGARIDEIAAATRTSKRMIYYYFGSKDGLYLAVLEEAYRRMRSIEADLHLDDLDPVAALRRLVAGGAQLRAFPKSVTEACFKAANELYAEMAEKSPAFKKIYVDWVKFRDEQVVWQRFCEVP